MVRSMDRSSSISRNHPSLGSVWDRRKFRVTGVNLVFKPAAVRVDGAVAACIIAPLFGLSDRIGDGRRAVRACAVWAARCAHGER